ncbi:hypothetical protein BOX15_Mlig016826g1, partial [Macrostomum lignano]
KMSSRAECKALDLRIVGLVSDMKFHVAKNCAADLEKLVQPERRLVLSVTPLLEFEWADFIRQTVREAGGEFWTFDDQAAVFLDGQLRGSAQWLLQWAMETYGYEDFRPLPLYRTLTEDAYADEFKRRGHDFVYLDISIAGEPAGRLVIELFKSVAPRTCENFRQLCTGERGVSKHNPVEQFDLCYRKSIFHRLVPEGWIQGGDIWYGKGNGGESVYGETFDDENFILSHDRRGVVGMANRGRHTNGSQFFITLKSSRWMDTKFVAFGRVVEGSGVLERMESVGTVNERPLDEIQVADCGEFVPNLARD